MKRYLILGAILAVVAVLLLLWPRRGGETNTPDIAEPPPQAFAATNPVTHIETGTHVEATKPADEPATIEAASNAAVSAYEAELQKAVDLGNQGHDAPVAFYGMVVDQDSNALQNAQVNLEVTDQYVDKFPHVTGTTTHLQRQTGADGRFEVTGLKGNIVTVGMLMRDGYEPELTRGHYGTYGAQSTSFENPIVFKMWSTNIHEPLISGEKSFIVIPDGRHYAVDLVKGTIAEGDEGDLVAWIKRPESVRWGQRYDWSCELTVPGGGLLEDSHYFMFNAPETGYTNVFAYQEEASINGWGGATGDKRFYVQLRKGQMYGRIVVNLYADYHGKQPAMIELSYAVNPSGSRLLR